MANSSRAKMQVPKVMVPLENMKDTVWVCPHAHLRTRGGRAVGDGHLPLPGMGNLCILRGFETPVNHVFYYVLLRFLLRFYNILLRFYVPEMTHP